MAILENHRLVIRVAYAGAPLAGKTQSIRALLRQLRGEGELVFSPGEARGRTVFFDWADYEAGAFQGHPISCQITSVPGQSVLSSRREVLLKAADAVILVVDSRPEGFEEARRCYEEMAPWLDAAGRDAPIGVILQCNKQDLPGSTAPTELHRRLALPVLGQAHATSATTGKGLRPAFIAAVRLAIDRARTLIERGLIRTGTRDVKSGQELLELLQRGTSAEEPSPAERPLAAPATEPARSAPPPAPRVEVAPPAPRVEVAPPAQRVEVAPPAQRVEVAPPAQRVEVAPPAPRAEPSRDARDTTHQADVVARVARRAPTRIGATWVVGQRRPAVMPASALGSEPRAPTVASSPSGIIAPTQVAHALPASTSTARVATPSARPAPSPVTATSPSAARALPTPFSIPSRPLEPSQSRPPDSGSGERPAVMPATAFRDWVSAWRGAGRPAPAQQSAPVVPQTAPTSQSTPASQTAPTSQSAPAPQSAPTSQSAPITQTAPAAPQTAPRARPSGLLAIAPRVLVNPTQARAFLQGGKRPAVMPAATFRAHTAQLQSAAARFAPPAPPDSRPAPRRSSSLPARADGTGPTLPLPGRGLGETEVWPSSVWRLLEHQLTDGQALQDARGGWHGEPAPGWYAHTLEGPLDEATARQRFDAVVKRSAELERFVSSQRCVALTRANGKSWIWQVVLQVPTLAVRLYQSLRPSEPADRVAESLIESALAYLHALEALSLAPERLPLGLGKIGAQDGQLVYVGLLPQAQQARPRTHEDRGAALEAAFREKLPDARARLIDVPAVLTELQGKAAGRLPASVVEMICSVLIGH